MAITFTESIIHADTLKICKVFIHRNPHTQICSLEKYLQPATIPTSQLHYSSAWSHPTHHSL